MSIETGLLKVLIFNQHLKHYQEMFCQTFPADFMQEVKQVWVHTVCSLCMYLRNRYFELRWQESILAEHTLPSPHTCLPQALARDPRSLTSPTSLMSLTFNIPNVPIRQRPWRPCYLKDLKVCLEAVSIFNWVYLSISKLPMFEKLVLEVTMKLQVLMFANSLFIDHASWKCDDDRSCRAGKIAGSKSSIATKHERVYVEWIRSVYIFVVCSSVLNASENHGSAELANFFLSTAENWPSKTSDSLQW